MVKFWKTIDITSICITDKTKMTVYCQKKGQTDWTYLGECDQQALVDSDYPSELTKEFNIQQSTERMRFKYVLETNDSSYSPVLYGQGGGSLVKARLLPERKKVIDAIIVVAPSYTLRDNTVVDKDMQQMLGTLQSLYEANAEVGVTGPDGEKEYTVLFDREGYDEQLAYDDEVETTENYWVTVKLLEV